MQRLLRRADWDIDGVRDDIRDYVVERLGHTGAVLVADDTGFIKKGTKSAGVRRQHTGTSGKRDNCQIGTFLAYVAPNGHALIDRHLYLPESWTPDRDRCHAGRRHHRPPTGQGLASHVLWGRRARPPRLRLGEGADPAVVGAPVALPAASDRTPTCGTKFYPRSPNTLSELTAGRYPGLGGPFVIAETPDRDWVGHADGQLPGQTVSRPAEVGILTSRWERIRGVALPARESLGLIKKAATSWT